MLHDADVKHAVETDELVELVVGEFIDLVFPNRFSSGKTIHFVAGFAIVVFPHHDVEILVVGVVEGVVD